MMEQWAGTRALGRSWETQGVTGSRPPSPGSAYRWTVYERYKGVRGGHAGDQSLDLGMDGRATSGRAVRELAPVLAEAAPLPPQDGVGGNDHEGLPPPGPASSQPDPEEAIRRAQLGSGRRSFVRSQLLQGKVLDSELAVAAEEEREESKHVEQEG